MKLLLIKDNQADAQRVRAMLPHAQVIVRGTATEGLRFLSTHSESLDAVLFDLNLPDSDSRRTLAMVNEMRAFDVPVILWSDKSQQVGKETIVDKEEFFEKGAHAQDYISERIEEYRKDDFGKIIRKLSGAARIIQELNERIQMVKEANGI